MDRRLYLRDAYNGELVTVLLLDNGDGTYAPVVKLGLSSKLLELDPNDRPAPLPAVKRASKKKES